MDEIRQLIRTIPDFPKPGILFRDITTLFENPVGLRMTIDAMVERVGHVYPTRPEKLVGIESRGFLTAGPLAYRMGLGVVLARKRNKLPGQVRRIEYSLEYGTDIIEIHTSAIQKGDKCLIVDDLLATGGTAAATCQLVEELGGEVVGCLFIVNLPELRGHERLEKYNPHWLVEFEGE